ncbi:uncharacterized protein snorc [Aplochiton taeniatus]
MVPSSSICRLISLLLLGLLVAIANTGRLSAVLAKSKVALRVPPGQRRGLQRDWLKASLMAVLAGGLRLRTCSQPPCSESWAELRRVNMAASKLLVTHSNWLSESSGFDVCYDKIETVADPLPTLRGEYQDTLSGGGAYDVTTKDPFLDITERVPFEYEDTTHSQAVDEDEGVLGPGAITAIVIAVFLGASVLLALIVITLRKFTAS